MHVDQIGYRELDESMESFILREVVGVESHSWEFIEDVRRRQVASMGECLNFGCDCRVTETLE